MNRFLLKKKMIAKVKKYNKLPMSKRKGEKGKALVDAIEELYDRIENYDPLNEI